MSASGRACYVRTSTKDQHGDAQREALKRVIAARWGEAGDWYVDRGVSSRRASRPELDKLRRMAHRGEVREVMMTSLSRLGRSVVELDALVREFDACRCKLIFLDDAIDTSTASGRLLFHVLGSVAEFERDIIRERVLAGMAAAKARGVKIGRPRAKVSDKKMEEAALCVVRGMSLAETARQIGVPGTTLRRAIRARQNALAEAMGASETFSAL